MKFKKKLWISLILFILFGTVFSGWIFHQNTTREHLVFDNTTQLVTTERSEDNIRIEDVILPDSFQNQQSILFKKPIPGLRYCLMERKSMNLEMILTH